MSAAVMKDRSDIVLNRRAISTLGDSISSRLGLPADGPAEERRRRFRSAALLSN